MPHKKRKKRRRLPGLPVLDPSKGINNIPKLRDNVDRDLGKPKVRDNVERDLTPRKAILLSQPAPSPVITTGIRGIPKDADTANFLNDPNVSEASKANLRRHIGSQALKTTAEDEFRRTGKAVGFNDPSLGLTDPVGGFDQVVGSDREEVARLQSITANKNAERARIQSVRDQREATKTGQPVGGLNPETADEKFERIQIQNRARLAGRSGSEAVAELLAARRQTQAQTAFLQSRQGQESLALTYDQVVKNPHTASQVLKQYKGQEQVLANNPHFQAIKQIAATQPKTPLEEMEEELDLRNEKAVERKRLLDAGDTTAARKSAEARIRVLKEQIGSVLTPEVVNSNETMKAHFTSFKDKVDSKADPLALVDSFEDLAQDVRKGAVREDVKLQLAQDKVQRSEQRKVDADKKEQAIKVGEASVKTATTNVTAQGKRVDDARKRISDTRKALIARFKEIENINNKQKIAGKDITIDIATDGTADLLRSELKDAGADLERETTERDRLSQELTTAQSDLVNTRTGTTAEAAPAETGGADAELADRFATEGGDPDEFIQKEMQNNPNLTDEEILEFMEQNKGHEAGGGTSLAERFAAEGPGADLLAFSTKVVQEGMKLNDVVEFKRIVDELEVFLEAQKQGDTPK